MFVKKTKVVLWPKSEVAEIYVNRPENNLFSFSVNLWQPLNPTDLLPLKEFCQSYHIKEAEILLPDEVAVIKSFTYDTQISSIENKELISLAAAFVSFPIDTGSVTSKLEPLDGKTLIRATLIDKVKVENLKANCAACGLTVTGFKIVSESIALAMSYFYTGEYFLIYSLNKLEQLLLLARNDEVYLSTKLKGVSFDIQKIINYSPLYFKETTKKIFLPHEGNLEVNSTIKLDQTTYQDSQINTKLALPANFPLPVSGCLITASPRAPETAIINNITVPKETQKTMESKKNILPVIIVFVVTVALASIIVYFIANRNSPGLGNPAGNAVPTDTIAQAPSPTEMPSPTAVPTIAVNKGWKIQVQNGTDINGQAGALKAKLTALGFKSVATGNAAAPSTQNVIELKPSLAGAAAYFQSSLAGYFDATIDTSTLTDTSPYDAVFIIGQKLGSSAGSTSATPSVESPTRALTTGTASATPTEAL